MTDQQDPCDPSPYNLTPCDKPQPIGTGANLSPVESQIAAPKSILKATDLTNCQCDEQDNHAAPIAGRQPPGTVDPLTKVPVPNELRPVPASGSAPCYLPQPEDELIAGTGDPMGPVGPWATGRVDWGPLAGLTGTRPVVDRYSISRFSEGEWRKHNKDMLDMATGEQHKSNLVDWNGRQCLAQSGADVDKNNEDSRRRLDRRCQDVHRWKCELEKAIYAASDEITLVEEQRKRLKQAMAVLQLPESIAGECLERRTGRLDPELCRDEVEEELIRELALTAEIRETFQRTLRDIQLQLLEDKTAKQRLEYDWSDKKQAHEIDAINTSLNFRSTVLLFKPGSTVLPDNQSSEDYWEHFTSETLDEAESTRQRSIALRGTLDAILVNASRDLRTQADKVDMALAKRIACTEEVTIRLENELKKILQRLADVEDIIDDLRAMMRRMDFAMKCAHTRLDNRLQRPRVENARDSAHFGLIEEVKLIGDNVAALNAQLKQAEESQRTLIKGRSELEREIMVKRKTLEIDRDRTQLVRSHYPSASALSGY